MATHGCAAGLGKDSRVVEKPLYFNALKELRWPDAQ
jgi:hypothetical protein